MALAYVLLLTLAITTIGHQTVRCEPEAMARPTRPKVFSSPDELRRYLDLVRDYYSLNGKARYGKRMDAQSTFLGRKQPWHLLRVYLAFNRQKSRDLHNIFRKIDKTQRHIESKFCDSRTLFGGFKV